MRLWVHAYLHDATLRSRLTGPCVCGVINNSLLAASLQAAESKLDPKARLFLQEARADIRSVMKAVVQFKRLVARRRAERAAANGGVDPLSHGLTSASNGAGGGAGAGSGTGSGSGRGVPPSSVNITPIEFDSGDVCVPWLCARTNCEQQLS